MKVLADLVTGEISFPGSYMSLPAMSLHGGEWDGEKKNTDTFSYMNTKPMVSGPTFMTSFNCNYLFIIPISMTVTYGVRPSTYEF